MFLVYECIRNFHAFNALLIKQLRKTTNCNGSLIAHAASSSVFVINIRAIFTKLLSTLENSSLIIQKLDNNFNFLYSIVSPEMH